MNFWKTTFYAVWTVFGVTSLVITAVYTWTYRGLIKSMREINSK